MKANKEILVKLKSICDKIVSTKYNVIGVILAIKKLVVNNDIPIQITENKLTKKD